MDLEATVRRFVRDVAAASPARNVVVGVQAAQGSGKTTLCESLRRSGECETVSLDDFYLPHGELERLRCADPERFALRGAPGSHDAAALARALRAHRAGTPARVPVYDKAARDGRGDRAGDRQLGAARCLVLEGWMVGFSAECAELDRTSAAALRAYAEAWALLDGLVVLRPPRADVVYGWRLSAEARLCARDVRRMVDALAPISAACLEPLCAAPPTAAHLVCRLDADRRLAAIERDSRSDGA